MVSRRHTIYFAHFSHNVITARTILIPAEFLPFKQCLMICFSILPRLTCSEPLGHLLYNYTQGKNTEIVNKCLPLAQAVYTKVGAHIQSAVCMCKQGRVRAMMEYAHHAKFSKGTYVAPK